MGYKSNTNFNSQIKKIVQGCLFAVILITFHRISIDNYGVLPALITIFISLIIVLFAIEKRQFKLASNVFCLLGLTVALYYMWQYEGARDEVIFILPVIIAYSFLTSSLTFSLFLIITSFVNIILIGYLTEVGIREQTTSTNSLASSILITILMSFSIYIFWVLLNSLNAILLKIKHALSSQNTILNNLGEALIIVDTDGKISQYSKSARVMFGYNKKELDGKDFAQLVPETDQYFHVETISRKQYIGYKKDGVKFDLNLVVTKTKMENKTSFIVLISDITEQIVFQNELKMARVTADEANQAKSDFLTNMSHEIRTPMNGVLGSLQMLEREQLSDNSKELVETAILSSSSLLTIINDY